MSQLVTPLLETTRLCGPPPARMVKLLEEQNAASTNATLDLSLHRSLLKLVDELEQRLELFFSLRFVNYLGTFSPASYSGPTKSSAAHCRLK